MARYRFYFLRDDDHIQTADDFEFANDADAFAAALKLMDDRSIEAWQSTRVVFRITLSPHQAEAA